MSESGAIQVNVAGPTRVHVSTGGSQAFTYLGWTRDGVMITPEGYWIDIKSDDNGGEAGPPSEIQYIGETSRIRCELTKYDANNALLLQTRVNGLTWGSGANTPPASDTNASTGQAGQVVYPGTLIFANSLYFKVCLEMQGVPQFGSDTAVSPTYRTYTRCLPRHAIEFNVGTKFSTFVVEFEAYKDQTTGVLFYCPSSVS